MSSIESFYGRQSCYGAPMPPWHRSAHSNKSYVADGAEESDFDAQQPVAATPATATPAAECCSRGPNNFDSTINKLQPNHNKEKTTIMCQDQQYPEHQQQKTHQQPIQS